ncbi:organic solvent tolerance protein OstA [Ancylobacter sp. 6x-1]|uniref:Organic solvent tolerance protein OstA n=2 Tax=Ancylobacter crimeensis TaxID=2579147 RepID=A0ABT0DAN8_9HYPH|nr:LptA/OstA family protein [Ancylobacter crimeensis]MCK0197023.1 organic solvent tolerance protein OstA [Ancylobacter crimeensis]
MLVLGAIPAADAQQPQQRNVPNALQGFATNRDQPIRIDADTLEVRDKDKAAIFSGNVVVVQGDTTLRCKELIVFYDGKDAATAVQGAEGSKPAATGPGGTAKAGETASAAAKPAAGTPAKPGSDKAPPPAAAAPGADAPMTSSSIRRLEMNGGVVVTTKEQQATGDNGVYEAKTNLITLTGNPVVLTQGPNVIRGKKLTVDLVTGTSRIQGGRVESLLVPNSVKDDGKGKKP